MDAYLPPIVTRLTAEIGPAIARIEELKKVIKSRDDMATVSIKFDWDRRQVAKILDAKEVIGEEVVIPVRYDVQGGTAAAARAAAKAADDGGFLASIRRGWASGNTFWGRIGGSLGGGFGALPPQAQAGLAVPAVAVAANLLGPAAAMIEALIPTLIGGAVGGLGIFAASKINPKLFTGLQGSFTDTLTQALAGQPLQFLGRGSGHTGGPETGGLSFMQGLQGILSQVSGFVKTIGPSLGDMFRASLPFISMFASVLENAAKVIIPAFTATMRAMTPFLPVMARGLGSVVQGFAGFLNALGPRGMKVGAEVFLGAGKIIEGILIGLGKLINFLAVDWAVQIHDMRATWDWLRHHVANVFDGLRHDFATFGHDTANVFDGIRHDIAHYWDMTWNNTVGRLDRGEHDVAHGFDILRHDVASIYDSVRNDIAHAWDVIWNNTVGRVIRGIQDVQGWFRKLPGFVSGALSSLGSMLLSIGKQAISDLLNGMSSVAPSLLGWVKGLASGVWHSIASFFGFGSPSRKMFQAGQWIVEGLANGIKQHQGKVGQAMASLQGHVSGNVQSWITQALAITHMPMSWLPALARMVQLESGGNPLAHNASGASGIAQTMPGTFAAYSLGGTMWQPVADLVASIRYIQAVYGSPFNIPNLFTGHYVGYAAGTSSAAPGWALVGERGPELVNFRGGEQVIPNGSFGDGDIVINIDGKEIFRVTQKQARKYQRRNGPRGSNKAWNAA